MFERFTVEAREAVLRAQSEASSRQDSRIGSEHLLIGVLEASPGVTDALSADQARQALERMDIAALRAAGVSIESPVPRIAGARKRHLPLTGSAKDVMAGALREAVSAGDRRIEGLHMLLAVTGLPQQDRAVRLMTECDVSPEGLRSTLLAGRPRS